MKKIFLILLTLFYYLEFYSQACGTSNNIPVINTDFTGIVGSDLNVIAPQATTQYLNSGTTLAPQDGWYRISNQVPPNGSWTSGLTGNGNFIIFNGDPTPIEFYRQNLPNLCNNVSYRFSVRLVDICPTCSIHPNVLIEIRNNLNVIASSIVVNPFPTTWQTITLDLPANLVTPNMTLRLVNNTANPNNIGGNDLAMDDIRFIALGPNGNTFFDNSVSNITKTVNLGNSTMINSSIGITPVAITNPQYQWEVLKPNTTVWEDIAGANNSWISYTPTILGTYQLRLKFSAQGNMSNQNCRFMSNCVSLTVQDAPCDDKCYWKLTGNTGITAPTIAIGTKIPTSGTGSGNYIGTQNTAPLVMATDQFERMRITETGNVGIGTISPNVNDPKGLALHINNPNLTNDPSVLRITNSQTGTGAGDGLVIGKWGTNSPALNDGMVIWNYENTPLIYATNSNERMRVTETGNVGIGTTTPTSRVDVMGSVIARSNPSSSANTNVNDVSSAILTNDGSFELYRGDNAGQSSTGGYIDFKDQVAKDFDVRLYYNTAKTNNSTAISTQRGLVFHSTTAGSHMLIGDNGNVGIGTTTPNVKLQVRDGDLRLDDVSVNTSTNGSLFFGGTTYNGQNGMRMFYFGQNTGLNSQSGTIEVKTTQNTFNNDGIAFRADRNSGGTERMRILSSNGNVGIGTTNPLNRLEITGFRGLGTNSNTTNNTGLRVTDVDKDNRNATIAANTFGNVLSVNGDGDVLMVRQGANNGLMVNTEGITQLGRDCGSTTNDANLLNNRELPMNNNNFIFLDGNRRPTDGNTNINRVGIGEIQGCNLLAKLHVTREYDANETFEPNRIGVLSNVSDGRGTPITGPSAPGFESAAFEGFNNSFNDGTNRGINLHVLNSVVNQGANILVDDPNNLSSNTNTTSVGVNIIVAGANGSDPAFGFANAGINSLVECDAAGIFPDFGIISNLAGTVGPNDWSVWANGDMLALSGVWTASDKNLKKDIQPIENALSTLSKLEPKKYDFDNEKIKALNLPQSKDNYGFIAQEIELVLPSLVKETNIPRKNKEDKEFGKIKVVNYTELIPIAIQAIKELNSKVEKQNNAVIENEALKSELARVNEKLANYDEKFALLEKSIAALCENGCGGLKDLGAKMTSEVDVLYQSIPNPTDDIALINYYLTREYKDAYINVSTQDGKQIQSFKLEPKQGAGSVKVSLGTLASGTYLYTLVAGERIVDTKRLQIVK